MNNMPEIKKTERDLNGQFVINFINKDDGKEFSRAFSELKAGIFWPLRGFPGYLCIAGLFSLTLFGKEDSLMLVYEKEYKNAIELMTDAYNRAADLRLQEFYTNVLLPGWKGYNFEFQRKIRTNLRARDIRLKGSPFADDFAYGKDVIKRLASQKALLIPLNSLLMSQLRDIRPEDLQADRGEERFHAITGFRFPIVAWDYQVSAAARRGGPTNREEKSSLGCY